MPAERFFLDAPLISEQEVRLTGQEAHHLMHVMRLSPQECVELVNGRHLLAEAHIVALHKKEVTLHVEHVIEKKPPATHLILCQALPRLNRLDTIVEKGTELGMHALWLFPGEKSERKALSENQQTRLRALTIAAMKQCGRLDLPEILTKPPLSQWSTCPSPAFYGDLDPEAPFFPNVSVESQEMVFFVGPESGFSPQEMTQLHALNVQGVRLHQNTLRTDTAAIIALNLLSLKQSFC